MKKKIITLLMSTLMVLSLVACGNETNKTESTESVESTTVESTESAAEEHDHEHESEVSEEELKAKNEAAYKEILVENEYDSLDYSKYVTLTDYKTTLESVVIEKATAEEVQTEIDTYLSYYSTFEEIKEGKLKEGDIINIELSTKVGEEDVAALSGSQLFLGIGEASLGKDFDTKILDAEIGKEITFTGVLPEEIETYGGKEATFTVTVNYIQGKEVLPEYNDEFVKTLTNGDYTKADEFKKYIEEYISESKAYNSVYDAINKISESATFTDIDSFIDKEYKDTRTYYEDYAKSMNVELAEFVKSYMGFETVEEFDKALKESATSIVKQKLTVYAICEQEKITLTEEEYREYADSFVTKYGYTSVADLVATEGASYLRSYCLMEKLIRQYL